MLTYFMSDLTEINQGLVRENVPHSSEPAYETNFFLRNTPTSEGNGENQHANLYR